jgi:hypothetical protein
LCGEFRGIATVRHLQHGSYPTPAPWKPPRITTAGRLLTRTLFRDPSTGVIGSPERTPSRWSQVWYARTCKLRAEGSPPRGGGVDEARAFARSRVRAQPPASTGSRRRAPTDGRASRRCGGCGWTGRSTSAAIRARARAATSGRTRTSPSTWRAATVRLLAAGPARVRTQKGRSPALGPRPGGLPRAELLVPGLYVHLAHDLAVAQLERLGIALLDGSAQGLEGHTAAHRTLSGERAAGPLRREIRPGQGPGIPRERARPLL